MTAYFEEGMLFVEGSGEMVDFASAADAPWAPVPAPGKQGFFYLMSRPSTPSDKSGVPFKPTPRLMSVKW